MALIDKARLQDWLFEKALPFWAHHGVDTHHGGPVEQLGLDGGPSEAGLKRVRVFARQLYVFSHGHILGWGDGRAHAQAMYEAMVTHAWQGPDLGWAKTLTPDNRFLDTTTDLYDNSFCLFALGWYHRICPNPNVMDLMMATIGLINTKLRHPQRGFWHQMPVVGPRLQNPHMHLLEACLVCFETTREPIFEAIAREVIGLLQSHFYNPTTLTLCEYFNDDLSPLAGPKGEIVEPGHQLEWAWILASAGKLFGLDLEPVAQSLVIVPEKHGRDLGSGAVFNAITQKGAGLDCGSRTWPNTERLKAGVALYEMFGNDTKAMINETLDLMFERYLTAKPVGGWLDAFDPHGQPIAKAMPTSTLYHIFLAFAEVLRVADGLNELASCSSSGAEIL